MINRSILNLRSLSGPPGSAQDRSGAGRYSQFSPPNFRVPSTATSSVGGNTDYGELDFTTQDDQGAIELVDAAMSVPEFRTEGGTAGDVAGGRGILTSRSRRLGASHSERPTRSEVNVMLTRNGPRCLCGTFHVGVTHSSSLYRLLRNIQKCVNIRTGYYVPASPGLVERSWEFPYLHPDGVFSRRHRPAAKALAVARDLTSPKSAARP